MADKYYLELAQKSEYQNKTPAEQAELANELRNQVRDSTLYNYRTLAACERLGETLQERDALISRFSGKLKSVPETEWKADQLTGEGWDFSALDMQASLAAMVQMGFSADDVARLRAVGVYMASDYEKLGGVGEATEEGFAEAQAEINKLRLLALAKSAYDRTSYKIATGELTDDAQVLAELGS